MAASGPTGSPSSRTSPGSRRLNGRHGSLGRAVRRSRSWAASVSAVASFRDSRRERSAWTPPSRFIGRSVRLRQPSGPSGDLGCVPIVRCLDVGVGARPRSHGSSCRSGRCRRSARVLPSDWLGISGGTHYPLESSARTRSRPAGTCRGISRIDDAGDSGTASGGFVASIPTPSVLGGWPRFGLVCRAPLVRVCASSMSLSSVSPVVVQPDLAVCHGPDIRAVVDGGAVPVGLRGASVARDIRAISLRVVSAVSETSGSGLAG